MKKFFLWTALVSLLSLWSTNNVEGQCAPLSIDTLYFEMFGDQIKGNVLNEGSWYVIYPYISISLDTNLYVSANDQIVQSYLDTLGGFNNGITSFFFSSVLLMPFSDIPENTILTGKITIEDPNDPHTLCEIPFQWQVRTGSILSSVKENSRYHTSSIQVFPNPASDQISITSQATPLHRVEIYNLQGKLIWQMDVPETSTELSVEVATLRKGGYLIRALTSNGWATQRLLKW
jgi:hypothetical protein